MRSIALGAFLVCVTASGGFAQQSPAEFWRTPGAVMRDAAGKVTYRETKDPAAFTMQVFDHGVTITYRYAPNTTKIVRAETADTSEDYLYELDGFWSGLTVHVKNLSLTLHASRSGTITAAGMPALSLTSDSAGRDLVWSSGGLAVGQVGYDAAGRVNRISLGNDLQLDISKAADATSEVLRSPAGVIVSTTTTGRQSGREFPYSLDIAAADLHLGGDWANSVRSRLNATGSLLTVTNTSGAVIAYFVNVGTARLAFTAGGVPLFYDVRLNYTDRASPGLGGDVRIDPTLGTSAVLPQHLVLAANGNMGAYVERPGDGAIQSFWTVTGGDGARRTTIALSIRQRHRFAGNLW